MAQRKPAPLIGVVMGSDSDWEIMRHAVAQLEAFGVPFEARPMSFAGKELRAPAYLALNPEGKVPTLMIDGRPLTGCGDPLTA